MGNFKLLYSVGSELKVLFFWRDYGNEYTNKYYYTGFQKYTSPLTRAS